MEEQGSNRDSGTSSWRLGWRMVLNRWMVARGGLEPPLGGLSKDKADQSGYQHCYYADPRDRTSV